MLNKLTLTITNDGETQVLATIAADVPEDGHSQVSIVEHCLARAPRMDDAPDGFEVEYAKGRYSVRNSVIFSFKSFDETEGLTNEFSDLLKEDADLDREDVIAAAVFMDLLNETLVDVEDGDRVGDVALVSTLLEEVEDAR
jgi:hypothetical protein